MSFENYADRNTSKPIVVLEITRLLENVQWTNRGAGIWVLSYSGSYDWVDATLLSGFTAQDFGQVGNVYADYVPLTKVSTLLEVTTTNESYYYDSVNELLYIRIINNDSPLMHSIFIGEYLGYTFREVKITGADNYYDPRLVQVPDLGRMRDPLFFGRLAYPTARVTLINADGHFDTFAEDNDVYGNAGRVLLGYEGLDFADYKQLFTGYLESQEIAEDYASFFLTDRRKQLSKPQPYRAEGVNPITAIKNILDVSYGIKYTSANFDTASFDLAETRAATDNLYISIYREDDDRLLSVIELIEEICQSIWGIFDINDESKYTFKFIEDGGDPVAYIPKTDIINSQLSLSYEPAEVISSVMVGYSRDWGDNSHTFHFDTTREAAVFARYKTYNQQRYETLIAGVTALAGATSLATRIMDYSENVRGNIELELPMRYYGISVGDTVIAQLDRPRATMLGDMVCEVLGVTYSFNLPSVKLKLRVIGEATYLVDHLGNYIVDHLGNKIRTE